MLRALALGAAAVCFACGGDGNARDVSGEWHLTSDYSFSSGSSCHATGLVTIDQDGPNITANIRNDVKPNDNYRCEENGVVDSMSYEGLLASGLVIDSRITMSDAHLDYSGVITGDPATQMSGSINLFGGTIGSWMLNR